MTEVAAGTAVKPLDKADYRYAPGWPGLEPRWTSSAKSGVGTALSSRSLVWFTLSHGILDEVYYPHEDFAAIRDLGFIVTDAQDFFSEEKRDTTHEVAYRAESVPAYKLTNTCTGGRYRLVKEIVSDPKRSVLLQRVTFEALAGELSDYHLYALLAPHLGDQGAQNTAWVADYHKTPVLFAERAGNALALVGSSPWLKGRAGFVGSSDGWRDLKENKQLSWDYTRAENGNVALTGEVDLAACGGEFVLALGFAPTPNEAAAVALSSLKEGFDAAQQAFVDGWQQWGSSLHTFGKKLDGQDLTQLSAAVLRVHESKGRPGAIIASLSIPWGFAHGDADKGGYHVVWPRDLVESAGGLLAAGAHGDARRILHYLQKTQHDDGHWAQNMWLDGSAYWQGLQLDETALPVLLVDLAKRHDALSREDVTGLWSMVRRAASYIVRNGPVTQQDRWEENRGYTPFTLAAAVAALLVAAELAEQQGEPEVAVYLQETADLWNASLTFWLYVKDTGLARQYGVEGYYVRIVPSDDFCPDPNGVIELKNRPQGEGSVAAQNLISADALALVRFGLRRADDPKILDTLKVIDALLKVETPNGPSWRRYNGDGYGEHDDGAPFDGTGVGRVWPVLTGERGHYELAAGNTQQARALLKAMSDFAGPGGLIPEQVWDTDAIPERELFFGQPSGSAMPLVWAHAEYVKLRRSLEDGAVFDLPPQTVKRYLEQHTGSPHSLWRFNHRARALPQGQILRIETLAPTQVHWSADGWQTVQDTVSRPTGLGLHVSDLPTQALLEGAHVTFTFYWPQAGHWENQNFTVTVEAAQAETKLNAARAENPKNPPNNAATLKRSKTEVIS